MYNASLNQNTIGAVYTRAQKELNERILRAICSDEEGYRRVTRNGTFDKRARSSTAALTSSAIRLATSNSPGSSAAHHLTVRCDGNSEPDTAFGGPMYYGHSPDGYSQRNMLVLSNAHRSVGVGRPQRGTTRTATMMTYAIRANRPVRSSSRGEQSSRHCSQRHDSRSAIGWSRQVMRDCSSPFRREDGDEVMDLVRRNGGMERMHLGFFHDANTEADKWNFWRLEGPGFVWNYRILDHVHCYVNIALPADGVIGPFASSVRRRRANAKREHADPAFSISHPHPQHRRPFMRIDGAARQSYSA